MDLARIIGTLTQPAAAGVAVGVLALWLLRAGLRPAAGLLMISGIVGAVLTTRTKADVQRGRPADAEGLVVDMNASYRSGHASAGIYLFLASGLVLLHRRSCQRAARAGADRRRPGRGGTADRGQQAGAGRPLGQ